MDRLVKYLQEKAPLAVAFSGGVDSALLLLAARKALGENVVAITARMDSFPERELSETKKICKELGAKHIICSVEQLDNDEFVKNCPDRCYICKKMIFQAIIKAVRAEGIQYIAEGSNADDMSDYRPGLKAVDELGIISPLKDCGYTKEDIRRLAQEHGLSVWDKPAYACLATRIPYNDVITKEKLVMIDKAEEHIMSYGIRQVRVRVHDNIARIEVNPDSFPVLLDEKNRADIIAELKQLGFLYVTLDIGGFKSGSMNYNI